MNIDRCRVGAECTTTRHSSSSSFFSGKIGEIQPIVEKYSTGSDLGRWPANLLLVIDRQITKSFPRVHGAGSSRAAWCHGKSDTSVYGRYGGDDVGGHRFGDSGSSFRFFKSFSSKDAE